MKCMTQFRKAKTVIKRIIFATFVVATTHALAQDQVPKVKQEAQRCANALLGSDYESVVAYTHKRVIDGIGGKEAMLAMLKRGNEDMRAQGFSFVSVEIGEPEKPREISGWLIVLVPEKIVMKVPGGQLETESHLLGISEDEGKSWVFVDIGPISKDQVSKEKFLKVFPELDGKIDFPEKKKPVFKKNK